MRVSNQYLIRLWQHWRKMDIARNNQAPHNEIIMTLDSETEVTVNRRILGKNYSQ